MKRTISTDGTASMTILARVFSWSEGAPNDVPFSKVACTCGTVREVGVTGNEQTALGDGHLVVLQQTLFEPAVLLRFSSDTPHMTWDPDFETPSIMDMYGTAVLCPRTAAQQRIIS